jgi:hypothetical protein
MWMVLWLLIGPGVLLMLVENDTADLPTGE